MLHPKYASTFRVMARFDGKLSVLSMTNYAILYYKKFIADDFGSLAEQVSRWYHNQVPSLMYYSSDHYRFWNTLSSMVKELSVLASKILSFIVQSAKRNRLSSEKMHFLTQVKRQVIQLIYSVCFYFINFYYCTR